MFVPEQDDEEYRAIISIKGPMDPKEFAALRQQLKELMEKYGQIREEKIKEKKS